MLLVPVVLYLNAVNPKAELPVPIVLLNKELVPTAVLYVPVVLFVKALLPTLVLEVTLPPPIPTETLPFTNRSPLAC